MESSTGTPSRSLSAARHGERSTDREWTSSTVARLRWSVSRRVWTLYWRDRDHRWHLYDLVQPTGEIAALL